MRRSRFCLQLQGQLQEGCLLRILFYQTKETANEVRGMNSLKKLFAQVDMTEGRPWEKIVLFTIPMIIGNVAQQLYNTVDSIVVGRYVGDNALAAVGSASPILNLYYGFPVFWFPGQRKSFQDNRQRADFNSGFCRISDDCRICGDSADSGAFEYAGQHHRLVF